MPFLKTSKIFWRRSRQLEERAQINGLRRTIFTPFNDRYRGEWKNSVKDGAGNYVSRSGVQYDLDWSNNFRHGVGILSRRRKNDTFGLIYRGDWKKGYKCGYGAMHYDDGGFCLGYWKNGKRDGYAQMWYGDGSFYDGDWYDDMREGVGLFVRPDGNRYEGEYHRDLKHGIGRFYHLDSGQMQEGVWKEDVCVYSTIIDIPYRQSAKNPTHYPIAPIEVVDIDDICDKQLSKLLADEKQSCLMDTKA